MVPEYPGHSEAPYGTRSTSTLGTLGTPGTPGTPGTAGFVTQALAAPPFEYLMLRAAPEAWRPEDTILTIRLLANGSCGRLYPGPRILISETT
jgi:hypothetical protein